MSAPQLRTEHRGTEAQRKEEKKAVSQGNPPNALPHHFNVEVDQQSRFQTRHPQISKRLRLVQWQQNLHRLEFQQQSFFNYDIQSVVVGQNMPFVDHRQIHLLAKLDALQAQFVAKRLFVRALKQIRSEHTMNFDHTADYFFGARKRSA